MTDKRAVNFPLTVPESEWNGQVSLECESMYQRPDYAYWLLLRYKRTKSANIKLDPSLF